MGYTSEMFKESMAMLSVSARINGLAISRTGSLWIRTADEAAQRVAMENADFIWSRLFFLLN